jgi:CYTH domain-containing protein
VADEIERKFIVTEVPNLDGIRSVDVRQGYLAREGDVEVRVRISTDRSTVTVKAGHGLIRSEVEIPLPRSDAEELYQHTVGRQVTKTRHFIDVPGGTAELDVFTGDLAGITTVEVEFDDESSAGAFQPPPWFGREITGDRAWSNESLARHGRPDER